MHHLLDAEFPTFFPMGIAPGIGAKRTIKNTNIGGLYMKIPIEIGNVTVFLLPHKVGKCA
jgi:hypothetical protein